MSAPAGSARLALRATFAQRAASARADAAQAHERRDAREAAAWAVAALARWAGCFEAAAVEVGAVEPVPDAGAAPAGACRFTVDVHATGPAGLDAAHEVVVALVAHTARTGGVAHALETLER